MVLKIAIPGKMQFKMMRREPYLLHRKGDVHYICLLYTSDAADEL